MNIISKSKVFAENKLFATLDTTVRKVVVDQIPFLQVTLWGLLESFLINL